MLLIPFLRNYFVVNWTLRPLYLLALSFTLAFFFTPIVRKIALKFKALDNPDARKVHIEPTPRWGGVAIYGAFVIVLLYNFDFSIELKGLLIGSTILVGVGLLDDRFGLSAKFRLFAQLSATAIAILMGARMTFLPDTWWGDILEIILTVIWFVGLTNAMNFLDGMDGLCAGLSAINSFFFAAVAIGTRQSFFMFLSTALCGACMGFLPYNFRRGKPALIFLGDTSSTFLGFTLAGLALIGDMAKDNYVAIIVPILILAIPIFDMSLTTFMRIKSGQVHSFGEWLHFTGKDHFHHRIADMGFGKRRTVQVILLIAICLGINGFIIRSAGLFDAGLLLVETAILFVFMGFLMVFIKKQYEHWAKIVSDLATMKGEETSDGIEIR
jgi:UDP-GlcNAc:undecaprenyl-phosphate GlcNAc-1-phosphate transferase